MAVPRHARRAAVHQEVARRVIVKTYGSFAVLDNTQHNTTLDDGSQARSDLCQDDADIDGWKI